MYVGIREVKLAKKKKFFWIGNLGMGRGKGEREDLSCIWAGSLKRKFLWCLVIILSYLHEKKF